ncbi:MAG: NYN domain-containing protein, partial [Oscillospiraceae bacterium]|nr:NYN domain-containing protein [Oscillospiraceae bacterium]
IVVFDAYKVKGNPGSVERLGDLFVVYTREAETADMYIEKTTYALAKERREHRVRVATSDGLEQMIILGHGAVRMSAAELEFELRQAEGEIRRIIGG